MQFRDVNGYVLQYGDIVEDLRNHDLCYIARSSFDDQPVLVVIKQFSRQRLCYDAIIHTSASACYERKFIPKHSRLYWYIHGYILPHVELVQHGYRNYRNKEI